MTKANFVELVQKNGGFDSKAAAERAVRAFTDSIEEALVKKESVSLVGFGTYSTTAVPEKSGKVPGTDKTYTKAAHTAPKFKFSKAIKDKIVSENQ